ncbi:carboxymuconolactone decarboxylase family protein (plasmid) [Streptomyces sp. NBC_00846]|uniref:carboxymuconolactone decarboxylase family protein n=1 Tax=Streptomyces sp. NBC_00846 TaxID=2975849 RepID=UPI002F90E30E|nr:carboxymuconolactone decarboxylase family protein [Streptomyces sp. NBC_00846]
MPHIALDNDLPGISGLTAHCPDTAAPLGDLANVLLRAPSSLSPGEGELIAAYVSQLNGTEFCSSSHGAFAAAQLAGGQELVGAVLADPGTAPVSGRLRALFLQPAAMGMLPGLRAATDPGARGGGYYGPLGATETRGSPGLVSPGRAARDPEVRRRLWEESERLTGVRHPF